MKITTATSNEIQNFDCLSARFFCDTTKENRQRVLNMNEDELKQAIRHLYNPIRNNESLKSRFKTLLEQKGFTGLITHNPDMAKITRLRTTYLLLERTIKELACKLDEEIKRLEDTKNNLILDTLK